MNDDPIHPILDAYLDAEATVDQLAKLAAWVNADAANAAAFARLCFDDRRLTDELRGRASQRAAMPIAKAPAAARAKPRRSPRAIAAAAIAATLVIGGVGLVSYLDSQSRPVRPVKPAAVVGVLLDSQDAVWISEPIDAGDSVRQGRLALSSGRIEVELRSGVVLELNGRADLDLASAMRVTLRSGQLWTRAEPGFRVDTPRFSVVDLGTEFGVTIDSAGGGQVHVLDGAVLVTGAASSETVIAGRGWAVDAAGAGRAVEYDPAPYVRPVDEPGRPTGHVHYAFDDGAGPILLDSGAGLAGGPFHGELAWTLPGEEGPRRVEGRFGRALSFDGINDYVSTAYRGIGGSSPRTVAMWVRIPANASMDKSLALMSYGRFETGRVWQMSWNSYAHDGRIGALRLGVLGHVAVGTTDLRDGRWHHVAAVYDGRTARLYVDARLDGTAAFGSLDTAVDAGAAPVTLGRNISRSPDGYFRGTIDEVYFFDQALSEDGIKKLMDKATTAHRATTDHPHSGD